MILLVTKFYFKLGQCFINLRKKYQLGRVKQGKRILTSSWYCPTNIWIQRLFEIMHIGVRQSRRAFAPFQSYIKKAGFITSVISANSKIPAVLSSNLLQFMRRHIALKKDIKDRPCQRDLKKQIFLVKVIPDWYGKICLLKNWSITRTAGKRHQI